MAGTRIGVIGCAGRVGRMLIADIVASEGCELAGGAAKPESAAVGQDLGEFAGVGRVGIAATGDARQVLRDSDVAIDFTTPNATASHAALAAELGRPIVIGTTGLSGEQEAAQRGRDGITGPRKAGAIGFAALRGGDNIGEHHVIFAGLGESLELTHRATNRAIYAKGAVRAARWLVTRPPGLYGMKEVLGL